MLHKILNKFNGLYYSQEYLCLNKESCTDPIHTYLVAGNKIIKDITNHHLFIGYSPLIFAIPSFTEFDLSRTDQITLSCSQAIFNSGEEYDGKSMIATIDFKKMIDNFISDNKIYFYEGKHAEHHFTNFFHQLIFGITNDLYNKKPGNVFLNNNLYKQVQIAYAFPRVISLITIGQGKLFNLFPTDLHGGISKDSYIISLRQGGKAAQQVESVKSILLSQIDPGFYKTVYALGKNHMQELKEKETFPFSDQLSEVFKIPLPQYATLYRELELIESFDHGIHRLFLFNIVNSVKVDDKSGTLAHIHNAYATWRHNNGLSGNYLLR